MSSDARTRHLAIGRESPGAARIGRYDVAVRGSEIEWRDGEGYDAHVGRWSAKVAVSFIDWLEARAGLRWLDVGCGTGALASAALARAHPASVVGIDPAMGYLRQAESRIDDARASFVVANAMELPFADRTYDMVVSGLVLNFVTDPAGAIAEQVRVVRPGGCVGAYVWDYRDGLEFLRLFWDAAIAVDPSTDEAARRSTFPIAAPDRLEALFTGAGLEQVRVHPIETGTEFASFDELWADFLGAGRLGQDDEPGWKGPSYDLLGSVDDAVREAIKAEYRARLTISSFGHIPLTARAWAVSGRRVERS